VRRHSKNGSMPRRNGCKMVLNNSIQFTEPPVQSHSLSFEWALFGPSLSSQTSNRQEFQMMRFRQLYERFEAAYLGLLFQNEPIYTRTIQYQPPPCHSQTCSI
jgi:hypothetical protein